MEALQGMTTICLLLGMATIFSGICDLCRMKREENEEKRQPPKENVIYLRRQDFYEKHPRRKAE